MNQLVKNQKCICCLRISMGKLSDSTSLKRLYLKRVGLYNGEKNVKMISDMNANEILSRNKIKRGIYACKIWQY